MITKALLFDSDRVRVIFQDVGSPTVCVAFNEFGTIKNGLRFWGDDLFMKEACACIGVVTSEPNWYPANDMAGALAAIREATAGRRVVTYGHSQGGYGALKFASALNATLAVSFCPQWSIDPRHVGSNDARYAKWFRPEWDNGSAIEAGDLGCHSIIVFDPHDAIDRFHAERILQHPGIEATKVPLSGHDSIRIVSESGLAAELVGLLKRDAPLMTAAELRTLIRRGRRSSATYRTKRVFAILDRFGSRPPWFSRLIADLPSGTGRFAGLLQFLQAGDLASASTILRELEDGDLFQYGFIRIWSACRSAGFLEGERRIAPLLCTSFSENAFVQLHAVDSYVKCQNFDAAITDLRRIRARFGPDTHEEFMARLAKDLGITLDE